MFLAGDGLPIGLLAVSDPVKASTSEAITTLQAAGLRVVMATGDGLITARSVAERLGIDDPVAVVIFGGLVSATLLDTLLTPMLNGLFGEKATRRLTEPEADGPQAGAGTQEAH